jgi:hypothetical protein
MPERGNAARRALPLAGWRESRLDRWSFRQGSTLPGSPAISPRVVTSLSRGRYQQAKPGTRETSPFASPHLVIPATPRRLSRLPGRPQAGSAAFPPAGCRCLGVRRFQISPLLLVLLVLVRSRGGAMDHLSLPEGGTGHSKPAFPHSCVPAHMPPGVPECRASRWRMTPTSCEGHPAAMMAVVVSGRTGFIVSSRWAFPPENWPHQPAQGCGLTSREGSDP